MKKTSSLADAKRKVAFAEAQLRIAKGRLAESKRLNEDVNGYTFKDLFGKDFDEVLKIAVERIAKIPEEHEELGFESVEDFLNSGSDSDLFDALEEEAGDETDRIAVSVIVALFDKEINLEQYNDLREKLGLDPIEVEKKESVASKKKNESEENHSWVDDVDTNGESMVKHLVRVARLEDDVDEETLETLEAIFEETFWDTDYKSEKEAARAVREEYLNLG